MKQSYWSSYFSSEYPRHWIFGQGSDRKWW